MNKLVILGFLAASATAVPTSVVNNVQLNRDLDCFEQENALFSCISVKTVSMLDRAARSSDIDIIDGVKFVRETPKEKIKVISTRSHLSLPVERNGKDLKTEVDIMNELPRDASDRAIKLMGMMFDSVMSFVRSHSLKLSMPEEGSISRALDEGRAKIKKIALPLIAAAGVKLFALIPIVLGSLGLLVMKALFVGKIALLLAGVLAFQRLFGSGNGATSFFNKNNQPSTGWVDNGGGQGWSSGNVAANVQPQERPAKSLASLTSE
ncbi:hypothetical protein APICC_00758 [Apis cerana cerana]|uniref:Osiris n=1 Tax=Apis cerana cerana TaxID=94128 RepID=A0A2A3EPD5_APICC|nr:hypothetical protein APICC_00758 [Apis cerana cerana]